MLVSIEYLYRDAGNNKIWGEAIFRNSSSLSVADLDGEIKAGLIDGVFFEPDILGLPVLSFSDYDPVLDHGWHEYHTISEGCCGSVADIVGDITELIQALPKVR